MRQPYSKYYWMGAYIVVVGIAFININYSYQAWFSVWLEVSIVFLSLCAGAWVYRKHLREREERDNEDQSFPKKIN